MYCCLRDTNGHLRGGFRIPVAHLSGVPETHALPMGVKILSFSCSFQQKKDVSTPNLGVTRVGSGVIFATTINFIFFL